MDSKRILEHFANLTLHIGDMPKIHKKKYPFKKIFVIVASTRGVGFKNRNIRRFSSGYEV